MQTFGQYLDSYKQALNLETDKALADHWGKTRQYVTHIRSKGIAPDGMCLEIARVLQVEPGLVLLSRNALKESGPVGEAWKRLLGRVAVVTLAIGAAVLYSRYGVENSEILLSFQVLASHKDYRKYLLSLIYQLLAPLTSTLLPVCLQGGTEPYHNSPRTSPPGATPSTRDKSHADPRRVIRARI